MMMMMTTMLMMILEYYLAEVENIEVVVFEVVVVGVSSSLVIRVVFALLEMSMSMLL